ncbi:hypothetical protein [Beijerinckia indica]|nr:hypothetical protein [Beijerinckia indica]
MNECRYAVAAVEAKYSCRCTWLAAAGTEVAKAEAVIYLVTDTMHDSG